MEKLMKNIIIMGVGRSGKTTLSKMIKRACPQYDVIHADAIKWGIIRALGKETEFKKNIEKQMEWEQSAFFQDVLIEIFAHNIKHNHTPVMLETGQLHLENIINHPKYSAIKDSTDIIVLGNGTKTKQQRMMDCKTYDVKTDWTYGIPDEVLSVHCENWEAQDLQRIKECEYFGIMYYNTSEDRINVMSQICQMYQ